MGREYEQIVDGLIAALRLGWAGDPTTMAIRAGTDEIPAIVAAVAAAISRTPRPRWRGHAAQVGGQLTALGRLGPASAGPQIVTVGRVADYHPRSSREGACGPPRIATATGGVLVVADDEISDSARAVVIDALVRGSITSGDSPDPALLPTYPVQPAMVIIVGTREVEQVWTRWGPAIYGHSGGRLDTLAWPRDCGAA